MHRVARAAGGDFLQAMGNGSARRAAVARKRCSMVRLEQRARDLPPPPVLRLSAAGFDVIAEVKRRSPSAGALAERRLDVVAQGRSYVRGGAVALSVLTEPSRFDGDLRHLQQLARAVSPVPVMRKDFLVDPYQVLEARAAGAAGVLLIVPMLDDRTLAALLRCALDLGLFVLVEVFDADDVQRTKRLLARAGPAQAEGRCRYLLGVNCRNLRTLQVDFGRFAALAPRLPPDVPWVAESGAGCPADVARVAELGYRLALVGTALMRSGDPTGSTAGLLEAGRASAPPRSPWPSS